MTAQDRELVFAQLDAMRETLMAKTSASSMSADVKEASEDLRETITSWADKAEKYDAMMAALSFKHQYRLKDDVWYDCSAAEIGMFNNDNRYETRELIVREKAK